MSETSSFLAPRKWILILELVLLFGLGLLVRVYDITDPPLDYHATRQLHYVVMARGMYYEGRTDIPDWQQELAVEQWHNEGLIEPPVLPRLTALAYQIAGGETLWIPRLFSILFWLAGGAAVFLLSRDWAGADGGLIALAYFLFLPFGGIASRSFQPDPLMTALIAFSLWGMSRWFAARSWKWVWIAGLLSGAALFSKAVAVFFVGFAWAALILVGVGLRQALRSRQVWALALLTVLPYAVFHIYGVYIDGGLQSQFSLRFFPQLWLDPVFYLQWKGMIASTLVFEWALAAVLASFLLPRVEQRAILLGAWAGYLIYGMALPYHISTHDYYQLPAIPLAALGLAVGAGLLFRNLRGPRPLVYPVVCAVLLAAIVTAAWDIRVTLKRDDFHEEPAFWAQLGEKVGRGSPVAGLTEDYGLRLAYWGWLPTTPWKTSGDINLGNLAGQEFDFAKFFQEQVQDKDYFIITNFHELDHQPELATYLANHYPVVEQDGNYIIYDLRRSLNPAQP